MNNIKSKIKKLTIALNLKGHIYLVNREQFYSEKKQKVCSIIKLAHQMPIDEYNELFPENKKDPKKYDYVKVEILKSFRQEDILLKLVEIYKKVGGADG